MVPTDILFLAHVHLSHAVKYTYPKHIIINTIGVVTDPGNVPFFRIMNDNDKDDGPIDSGAVSDGGPSWDNRMKAALVAYGVKGTIATRNGFVEVVIAERIANMHAFLKMLPACRINIEPIFSEKLEPRGFRMDMSETIEAKVDRRLWSRAAEIVLSIAAALVVNGIVMMPSVQRYFSTWGSANHTEK